MLNSTVFQAGGLVVIVVEIFRKNFLASIVPVIVNAVLDAHHLVVDIVAFVSRGDFPRSRLGEKQRGKILASWVTRKMRTIAQFSIRDPDGSDSSQVTMTMTESGGLGTGLGMDRESKNGSLRGTGIGMSASVPSLKRVAEDESQQQHSQYQSQSQSLRQSQGHFQHQQGAPGSPRLALNVRPEEYQSIVAGVTEMPTGRYNDNDSLDFSRNSSITKSSGGGRDRHGQSGKDGGSYYSSTNSDATPTEPARAFELPATNQSLTYPSYGAQYSGVESNAGEGGTAISSAAAHSGVGNGRQYTASSGSVVGNGVAGSHRTYAKDRLQPPVPAQPHVDQQSARKVSGGSSRSADRASVDEGWPMEAIMHMNLENKG